MPPVDLDRFQPASPCPADWDAMQGDDRVRFCTQCELNVYNLSALTRPQAQAFMDRQAGRVCVRMFKRSDGTLLTQDCPVGLRAALRRRLSWLAGFSASVLAAVGGALLGARNPAPSEPRRLPVVADVTSPPKPTGVNQPDCKLPDMDLIMGAVLEPEADAEIETEAESESETDAETEAESEADAETETETETETDAEAEPTMYIGR